MDRQQAKQILKNTGYIGNEVGVAFDVAIKSMDKLEKIEQIMKKYQDTVDNFYSGKPRDLLESDVLRDIREVLENE